MTSFIWRQRWLNRSVFFQFLTSIRLFFSSVWIKMCLSINNGRFHKTKVFFSSIEYLSYKTECLQFYLYLYLFSRLQVIKKEIQSWSSKFIIQIFQSMVCLFFIRITLVCVILIISYVHYSQAEELTTESVPTSFLSKSDFFLLNIYLWSAHWSPEGNLVEGNVSNIIVLPASKMNLSDTPKGKCMVFFLIDLYDNV